MYTIIIFVLFAYRGKLTHATRLTGVTPLNRATLSACVRPWVQPLPNYYNGLVACIKFLYKRFAQLLKSPRGSAVGASDDPSRFLFLQIIFIYVFPLSPLYHATIQSQQLFSYENLTNLLRLYPSSQANNYF